MTDAKVVATINEHTEVALPGDLISRLAQYAQETQDTEQVPGQFFSTRAGVLSFNKMPLPNNTMDVVVLRSMFENVYYPEKFTGDKITAPICFAFSHTGVGMAPHEGVTEAMNPDCESCKFHQWNSGDNGRGKACKEMRRLSCLPVSALASPELITSTLAGYLRVPVTSVKFWSAYAQRLAAGKIPPFAAVTRIKLVPDPKSQFIIQFEPVRTITNPDIINALFARHDAEANALAFPYPKREAVAVPPPPGTVTPSPVAGPSKF